MDVLDFFTCKLIYSRSIINKLIHTALIQIRYIGLFIKFATKSAVLLRTHCILRIKIDKIFPVEVSIIFIAINVTFIY